MAVQTLASEKPQLAQRRGRSATPLLRAVIGPLCGVLRQLGDLLRCLSDEEYIMCPVGVVRSSIGGHIRHNLDHIESLLAGYEYDRVDYDQRRRGTEIEYNRRAALARIERLASQLLDLAHIGRDRRLVLSTLPVSDAAPIAVRTSLCRELAFVLSHTIHHNAIIGVMARTLGVPLPEHFGYAPSTIAHMEKQPCAQ